MVGKIEIEIIEEGEDTKNNTQVGYIDGIFENNSKIKEELKTVSISEFFNNLISKIEEEC